MGVAARRWVLPRSRALWIPAGIPHDVLAGGRTRFVSLYFDPDSCPIAFTEPTVIDSSGLLGHLIVHLAGPLPSPERERAESVLFDLVRPLPSADLTLPAAADARVREIAAALADDPSDRRTLAGWGRSVGASSRTLARAIRADTGMTFAAWRAQIRMVAALELLAAGRPVVAVAPEVGYTTASAFVAAFKRAVGTTPGRYFMDPASDGVNQIESPERVG
jgi:AraC-like DNA-binding protein